jgi:hypothetical protein
MAMVRVVFARTPDGDVQLVTGRDAYFVVAFLDENGSLLDLTSDTIACNVIYSDGTKDTWPITKRADQSGAGKGLADLQAPAAKNTTARAGGSVLGEVGLCGVDILWNNSVVRAGKIFLRVNETV